MSSPIDGVSGVSVPIAATRIAIGDDVADLVRLIQVADAELFGRKGAWLRKRFDVVDGSMSEVARWLVSYPETITLVGLLDDIVVGFATGHIAALHKVVVSGDAPFPDPFPDAKFVGVIDGLYVEPDGRAVSVGDALVLAILDHFRDAGCVGVDAWALPGERETKNFYEAHAFSARSITVHHSFIGPTHTSRTEGLRASDEP